MNLKIWKSLAVLLLSLEFLTPAFVADYSAFNSSEQSCFQNIPEENQKSPTIFVAEETDVEEGQRDSQVHKTIVLLAQPVIGAQLSGWQEVLEFPVSQETTQSFDTHPPLFRLHCLLLL